MHAACAEKAEFYFDLLPAQAEPASALVDLKIGYLLYLIWSQRDT